MNVSRLASCTRKVLNARREMLQDEIFLEVLTFATASATATATATEMHSDNRKHPIDGEEYFVRYFAIIV